MRYVIMFRYIDGGIIETIEKTIRPEIMQGDYITLDKGEMYKVETVVFNHDVYNDRVFIYVSVDNLSDEDQNFIESVVTK